MKFLIGFSLGVSIFCLGAVVYLTNVGVNKKDLVYTMCQESRMYDTVSEETCGALQDKFNMEFLCSERNKSITNTCWVEEK